VGGQQPSWLKYVWNDGTHYDVTNSSNWSSTQPAVATVLSAGGNYPGLVTGVSAGTATINSYYYPQVPIDTGGQVCGNPPVCPTVLVSGSETVTVCQDDFLTSQFNANCGSGSQTGSFGDLVGPQPQCFVNNVSCATGTVTGNVDLDANHPISCQSSNGYISGSLGYFAGNPGQHHINVGSIQVLYNYTVNGLRRQAQQTVTVTCN
jgi:hypothetical protein